MDSVVASEAIDPSSSLGTRTKPKNPDCWAPIAGCDLARIGMGERVPLSIQIDHVRDAGGTGSVRSIFFITCHVSVADDTEVVPPYSVAAAAV